VKRHAASLAPLCTISIVSHLPSCEARSATRSVPDFYELELCKEYDSNGSSNRSDDHGSSETEAMAGLWVGS